MGAEVLRRADKYQRQTLSRSTGGDRNAGNIAAHRRHPSREEGHTITSALYCTILMKLRAAIRRKRPGLLTKGVLLLHDNACPHSANLTTATLRSFKWEVLQHPPYSPDLALSDFHLFGPLKHHLSGERFPGDDAVERALRAWFRQQP